MVRSTRSTFGIAGLAAAMVLAACQDQADPTLVAPDAPSTAAFGVEPVPFLTAEPALAALSAGVDGELTPLATAGDVMPGSGETLFPLPDGIGVFGGNRYVSLMLNHELDGTAGYFARVSKLTIDTKRLAIVNHTYVLDGTEGYERLCSAEWVEARDGFPGGYFFTGEENSQGVQLAIDKQGNVTELRHIGLYNHENQISVPGFPDHVVVLNFDDNGGRGAGRAASKSELYMYVAESSDAVLSGEGQLYIFKADDTSLTAQDLAPGDAIQGHWLAVPAGVEQDAGQLQQFAQDGQAFPFVRLEDGFYDARPGAAAAAYFYDTGRGSITDDQGEAWDPWGSIYRIEFNDPTDPADGSATLRLLARSTAGAGDNSIDEGDGWASPDNGAMSADGVIMLQEDPANGAWNRAPSVWMLQAAPDGSLVDPAGQRVAQVTDPDCPDGPSCSDVTKWETSGVVDASRWFGPGAWLFDVQAHTKETFSAPGLGDVETGQLLLLQLH